MAPPTQVPQVFVRIDSDGVYKAMLVNPNPEGNQLDPNRIAFLRVYTSPDESEPYGAAVGDITIPQAPEGALLELAFNPGALGVLAFSFVNAQDPAEEGPISPVAPYVYGSALSVEITLNAQAICKTAPTGLDILKGIQDASRLVDMYTDNFFYPKWLSKPLNGHGANDIPLDVAIIYVAEVLTEGHGRLFTTGRNTIDACEYKVFNRHIRYRKAFDPAFPNRPDGFLEFPGDSSGGMTLPDDRQAPMISFRYPNEVRKGQRTTRVHTRHYRHTGFHHHGNTFDGFPRGRQNILVKGFFGFTEPDLSTPVGIRLATERLVLRNTLISRGTQAQVTQILKGHNVVMEKTDTHFVMFRTKDPLQGAFTGEALIDQYLARYVRVMQIGAV